MEQEARFVVGSVGGERLRVGQRLAALAHVEQDFGPQAAGGGIVGAGGQGLREGGDGAKEVARGAFGQGQHVAGAHLVGVGGHEGVGHAERLVGGAGAREALREQQGHLDVVGLGRGQAPQQGQGAGVVALEQVHLGQMAGGGEVVVEAQGLFEAGGGMGQGAGPAGTQAFVAQRFEAAQALALLFFFGCGLGPTEKLVEE